MYKTLNDAAVNQEVGLRHRTMLCVPEVGAGSIEIWFDKNPSFNADDARFVSEGVEQTHAKLGTVAFRKDWQTLYGPMQGEFWSPNGEANHLIRSLGLHHTSMSVGDVLIVNFPDGKSEAWMVADTGWKLVWSLTLTDGNSCSFSLPITD